MAELIDKKDMLIRELMSMSDEEIFEKAEKSFRRFSVLMAYYRCAMMEIETKFNVLNEAYTTENDRSPISSVKTRLKTPRSIAEKLRRQGKEVTPDTIWENLSDIAGVRVICSFTDDVYALAEAFLKQDDIKLIEKKDYIKNPKPNGYRSLHLIVEIPIFLFHEKRMIKVEIQMRTLAMDFWASLEHQMKYKKKVVFTDKMSKDLLLCAETCAVLDERMNCLWNESKNPSADAEEQ